MLYSSASERSADVPATAEVKVTKQVTPLAGLTHLEMARLWRIEFGRTTSQAELAVTPSIPDSRVALTRTSLIHRNSSPWPSPSATMPIL